MGNEQNSEPVLTKESFCGNNEFLRFGCSGMQGYMDEMKDMTSCDLRVNFPRNSVAGSLVPKGFSFFSVITGDGEKYASEHCKRFLPKYLSKVEERRLGQVGSKKKNVEIFSDDEIIIQTYKKYDENLSKHCLKMAIQERGKDVIQKFSTKKEEDSEEEKEGEENEKDKIPPSSCCYVTSIIMSFTKDTCEIICNQLGNNKCVVNDASEIFEMTFGHNPNTKLLEKDSQRIPNDYIQSKKILGKYSSCRMLGIPSVLKFESDEEIKKKTKLAVIPEPSIKRHSFYLKKDDSDDSKEGEDNKNSLKFIVIASRGVWDVMKPEEVCEFIKKKLLSPDNDDDDDDDNDNSKKNKEEEDENKEEQEQLSYKDEDELVEICNELLDECVIRKKSKICGSICLIKLGKMSRKQLKRKKKREIRKKKKKEEEIKKQNKIKLEKKKKEEEEILRKKKEEEKKKRNESILASVDVENIEDDDDESEEEEEKQQSEEEEEEVKEKEESSEEEEVIVKKVEVVKKKKIKKKIIPKKRVEIKKKQKQQPINKKKIIPKRRIIEEEEDDSSSSEDSVDDEKEQEEQDNRRSSNSVANLAARFQGFQKKASEEKKRRTPQEQQQQRRKKPQQQKPQKPKPIRRKKKQQQQQQEQQQRRKIVEEKKKVVVKKKKKKILRKVVVDWDFQSSHDQEMEVRKGDHLVVHMNDGKWLYCQKGKKHGFVPTNHVSFI